MATRVSKRVRTTVKKATPLSIRLEPSLLESLQRYARGTGKPLSRVVREMLDIALRTQTFPGIVIVDGPAGRRAHLAGTGLDVWEVIELLREFGSPSRLQESFPHLSLRAIQVAEAYAKAYPEEINRFLELNARTPEQLREGVPWLEVVRSS